MSHPIPDRLVVATHNRGKFREFQELLSPYVKDVVSAADLSLPSPEETGETFAENALIKAKAAALASQSLALADDSGLCVAALDGKPGIFSARWAEPKNDFTLAMQRIQDEIADAPDRTAHFSCVLTLCWPDGHSESVEGRIDGTIVKEPRGLGGHGYDPIFIPNGYTITFAEMSDEEKNRISHRGKATRALLEKFFREKHL